VPDRARFRIPRPLILLLLLMVLAVLGYGAFRKVGGWLVVADPLERSRAIVVLSGLPPYRAMAAADLYRQGWAPEVWLTTDDGRGIESAFARLGIPHPSETDYNRQVLTKLGVPAQAIHVLPTPIRNTADELSEIAATLREAHEERVIIITSPPHTRRVRTIWHILVGGHPQVIVRYDSYEDYHASGWWRITSEVDDVVREVLGLINARLGFIARPKD
jgi:uncharacterized SAM-binding protein YcdF (DUF218 family)